MDHRLGNISNGGKRLHCLTKNVKPGAVNQDHSTCAIRAIFVVENELRPTFRCAHAGPFVFQSKGGDSDALQDQDAKGPGW